MMDLQENEVELVRDEATDRLFLTFSLGGEEYGIEILYVKEITGMQNVTKIPNMPDYVKGVINLRGQVIPVIDVRTRFGLEFKEYGERTCAIVVNIEQSTIGLLVDAVEEVINISEKDTSMPEAIRMSTAGRFVKGLGQVGDKVVIMLDVQKIFFENEIENLTAAAVQAGNV